MHTDDPVEMYLREVASIQPLSTAEELTLWGETKSPDETRAELAKRRLIESRLPLVVSIAEQYPANDIPMLDLIQEGNRGLMVALNTFLEKPRDDFSAHATACIKDAIATAIAQSQSK